MRFSLWHVYVDFCDEGLQPDMVVDLARACLDTRFFFNNGPEPNLHLEIPDIKHGRIAHGTFQPCFVSRYESRRRDHRDWSWRRDTALLERFPEEGEQ